MYIFIILARKRFIASSPSGRKEKTQVEETRATPKFILHGCQVSRML